MATIRKIHIEIRWGVIFFLVSIAWSAFEKFMGWHGERIGLHAYLTNLFALPAIALFVLALADKRKNYYDNRMNWLQGFVAGVMLSLVIALLSPLAQIIITRYISPEFFPNAISYAVETERLTRHQAERYFTLGNYILQGIIGSVALGTLTSAVVAIFMRRK